MGFLTKTKNPFQEAHNNMLGYYKNNNLLIIVGRCPADRSWAGLFAHTAWALGTWPVSAAIPNVRLAGTNNGNCCLCLKGDYCKRVYFTNSLALVKALSNPLRSVPPAVAKNG